MNRFLTTADATAAGFAFAFNADRSQFEIHRDGDTVGVAHVSDFGELRDFDHTVVDDAYRGTGLSGVFAEFALTHESTVGKELRASCSFIQRMLQKHPETVDESGRATGAWN